jgi:ArsR family transcriptional regulator
MRVTAQLLKALSEEVRLRILTLLLDGERCVCDLMAVLDLPQSTISRHLAYLKNAGWVEGERRGVWMYYRLTEEEDGFHGGLLELVAAYLPKTEEGAADTMQLTSFLKQKGKNACG